jgi:hypothetical protein
MEYNVGWTASDLPIPGTATVAEARLFVPFTWDKAGVMPASVNMSFNVQIWSNVWNFVGTGGTLVPEICIAETNATNV